MIRFREMVTWLFVLGGVALCTLSVLILTAYLSQDRVMGQTSYSRVLNVLVSLIGPDHTYVFVAKSVQNKSISEQHRIDHYIARVLYKRYGAAALASCDPALSRRTGYGCYHEIIGRNIIESNSSAAQNKLLQSCRAGGGGWWLCEHAVGHGYASYYGYSLAGLHDAIAACDTLTPSRGCHGGAYMEFLFRGMHEDGLDPAPLTDQNRFAMCAHASPEHAAPCYYWQAKWWWLSRAPEYITLDEMSEVVEMCHAKEVPETVRDACFAAIGHSLVSIQMPLQELGTLCDKLFKDTEAGAHTCRTYAARRLARAGTINHAPVCTAHDGTSIQSCVEKSATLSSSLEQDGFYDEL